MSDDEAGLGIPYVWLDRFDVDNEASAETLSSAPSTPQKANTESKGYWCLLLCLCPCLLFYE